MSAPANVPKASLPEREEDWRERPTRPGWAAGDAAPGAWLLGQSDHFLVRAERRRIRRWRRIAVAACLVPPLALAGLIILAAYFAGPPGAVFQVPSSLRSNVLGLLVSVFAAYWPLAMVLGAALSTATAVVSERTADTATQLVLTPVAGDAIAASRISPRLPPFMWGVLAAAPIYLLAGSGEAMLTPLAFWPWRMLAPLVQDVAGLHLSGAGAAVGIFMLGADLMLVYAAAHWGACYAVWLGSLPGVALYLAWRLFYVSMVFIGWALLSGFCVLGGSPAAPPMELVLALPFIGALLLLALWFFTVRGAVRMTLEEFSRFDRLADDHFQAGYFKRFKLSSRRRSAQPQKNERSSP